MFEVLITPELHLEKCHLRVLLCCCLSVTVKDFRPTNKQKDTFNPINSVTELKISIFGQKALMNRRDTIVSNFDTGATTAFHSGVVGEIA